MPDQGQDLMGHEEDVVAVPVAEPQVLDDGVGHRGTLRNVPSVTAVQDPGELAVRRRHPLADALDEGMRGRGVHHQLAPTSEVQGATHGDLGLARSGWRRAVAQRGGPGRPERVTSGD